MKAILVRECAPPPAGCAGPDNAGNGQRSFGGPGVVELEEVPAPLPAAQNLSSTEGAPPFSCAQGQTRWSLFASWRASTANG